LVILWSLVFVGILSSCEIGKVTVPATPPGVVVHAVLNAGAINQIVLLEQTLSGVAEAPDTNFNSADPIVSAGGLPIFGATVDIIDSAGRAARGVEDQVTSNGVQRGTGVYRVPIAGSALVLGSRYQLRIRTPDGKLVTAFTRVPRADVRSTGSLTQTMNRDHDILNVQWPAATTRTYAVRIESPYGPFFLFTDSTRLRFTGQLRNVFSGDLEHVFIPGFRQDILVAAVDSNFYDYYRTNNDPFTGSGIISRIDGGIGVFGSLVTMTSGTLTVTADRTGAPEGRYRFLAAPSSGTVPLTNDMTVYIESPSAGPNLPTALSGRYTTTNGARVDGILGQEQDGIMTLQFLNNQQSGRKVDTFVGTLHGDTLIGSFQRTGGNGVSYFLRTP
jgi:hypothetical protein